MRRLVIYTYFFIQILAVSFGLIQVELAMKGAAAMQADLWLLQLLKPILLVVFALAVDEREPLAYKLYAPQILVDIAYVCSTSNHTSWLLVGLGYALFCLSMLNRKQWIHWFYRLMGHSTHERKPVFTDLILQNHTDGKTTAKNMS